MGQLDVDLTGQTIDGRYRIERCIGTGGMGAVWRAQHIQTLQHFAIKTLRVSDDTPDGSIQRCLKEARAAAALRSRHVVRVTDVQPDYRLNTTLLPYLVMELLEGVDFESVLERRKSLVAGEVSWVLGQLCRGIQTAHDGGIVHRDLKPANLFLATDDDGSSIVKICDFGLAKLAPEGLDSDGLSTETGVIVGTPRYMAPEQLRGTKRVATATDQWAIGLIAYRMLAGSDYFDGAANAVELSLRIVHDELPAPSRCSELVPREFDEWFFRSCARDPERRFRSVQAQAESLIGILGEPIPIELDEWRQIGDKPRRSTTQVESIAATVASESGRSGYAARGLYVALGISAGIGIIGTAAITVLQPFRAQGGSSSREPSYDSVAVTASSVVVQQQPSANQVSVVVLPNTLASTVSNMPQSGAVEMDSRISRSRAKSLPHPIASAKGTHSSEVPTASGNQGLLFGSACTRSAQCSSHLCVAERCR